MGIGNLGWSGLVLILVALLLVFGPSKLPEIGKAFGKSLREFKKATSGIMDEATQAAKEEPTQVAQKVDVEPIELKTEKKAASEAPASQN
jgi:sec-independent protein translocase protein TatA